MDILSMVLISVGLAMDCFAVSMTQGLKEGKWRFMAAVMAVLFGLFQGGMPLIGFFAGNVFSDFFSLFAPWIALGLLSFIGGKMIWENLNANERPEGYEDEGAAQSAADWRWTTMVMLAVATSIDALATGVIFIPCPDVVWTGVGVIALGSLLFALAGYLIGMLVGKRFKVNMGLIGGIILVGLGLKIWIEGLWF